MRIYNDLGKAVVGGWQFVLDYGKLQRCKNWQGKEAPRNTIEAVDFMFRSPIPPTDIEADHLIKPNMPWALKHFMERTSGKPLNPPPSSSEWPFANKDNEDFKKGHIFDHTYPERFWPKYAGRTSPGLGLWSDKDFERENNKIINSGIRFDYGDLDDVINKLREDPSTRQAYFPIWFPEDTGKNSDIRVPCSLGYHFMIRDGRLDIKYMMRSTDMLRHYQDDLYMACSLASYVRESINAEIFEERDLLSLGYITFITFSAHVFEGEEYTLKQKIKKLCAE